MAKTIEQENEILNPYPLMPNSQRIALWNNAKGIWKDRQPDPIEELEKQREEWDEDLPNNS